MCYYGRARLKKEMKKMLENINEKDLYVGYIKNEEPTLTVLKKENNGYTLLFLNNKL